MAKTVHIIRFNHRHYYVETAAAAIKVMEVLAKLKPVKFHYREGDLDSAHYYPDEEEAVRLELEMNQPFRPREKALQLPKPKRGSRRCECGRSDVAPFESCASCGKPHPNA
jgi:hypothetical protein